MQSETVETAVAPRETQTDGDSALGQVAFWLAVASAAAYVALNQGLPNHTSFVLEAARKVAAAISR